MNERQQGISLPAPSTHEKAREQLRADALAAWAEYAATGRHATDATVDAWLARLEAGEAADPPPA